MRKKGLPSFRLDASVTDEVIYSYYRALDCPRSLACKILYESGEHEQLANLVCRPEDYADAFSFRDAYQATHFLRKATFLKVKSDPKLVALEKFEESEAICKETNRVWRSRRFENGDWNMIHRVSRKITSILDYSPNIDRWLDRSSWGPGASLSIKKREASGFKKYRDERGITIDARCLIPLLDAAYPCFYGRMYQLELGDRVVVVPKDATQDRVILIQPGFNLWLQKGCGELIRQKLRFCGLDLNVAPERHHEFARLGSKYQHLSTLDLKSASDRLAIEPLREVLPPDWFKLLDLLRSKRSCDGRPWEKFSSMGNGFTFELETLVFYSIALCVCEKLSIQTSDVSVFGDDVIIPTAAVDLFRHTLGIFGFQVNEKKSFSSSPFRESCGSHFYDGVDCKPIFLKERISDVFNAYKVYNNVRHLAHRRNSNYGCDSRFRRTCRLIENSIPESLRLRIPFGFGEVGLISNFDEARPAKARDGWQGFVFKTLSRIPLSFATEEPALLWVRLTEHSDRERRNFVDLKARTKVRLTRTYAKEWYNLGPWI